MRKILIFSIILFLFLVFPVYAENWQILITDFNGIPFYEEVIEVHYEYNSTTITKYSQTNASGYLNLDITADSEIVEFILRAGGSIYYASSSIGNDKVKLRQIAKITAFVIDDKDNYLKDVDLKISCSEPISAYPETTNEIGYFEIEQVGLGECSITMIKGHRVQSYQLNISSSKEYSVKILFPDDKISIATPNVLLILMLIVIFAVIVIIILLTKVAKTKRKLDEYTKEDNDDSNKKQLIENKDHLAASIDSNADSEIRKKKDLNQFNQRQKDIMKTLSENENKIILFLFTHEFHATQSQIRHNTNLPKATLHRHISKLQMKGIVSVEEYGKLKKVLLTEFFLRE